jgi:uncharacterized protein involved in exopolysaccharide biosynthesis
MVNVPTRNWDEGPGVVQSVWRFRWLVLVATLLGGLAGYLWSSSQTPVYETGSRLVFSTQPTDILGHPIAPVPDPDRHLRNQAEVVMSPPVLALAAELSELNLSAQDLAPRVAAEPSEGVDVITVSVREADPQRAATIADSVAKAYQLKLAEQARRNATKAIDQLEAEQAALRASLRRLQSSSENDVLAAERDGIAQQLGETVARMNELRLRERLADGGVQLIQPAPVPAEPAEPRPRRTATVAALVVFLLTSGLAWWLAGRDATSDGQDDHSAARTRGDGARGRGGRNTSADEDGAEGPSLRLGSNSTVTVSKGDQRRTRSSHRSAALDSRDGDGDLAVPNDNLMRSDKSGAEPAQVAEQQ